MTHASKVPCILVAYNRSRASHVCIARYDVKSDVIVIINLTAAINMSIHQPLKVKVGFNSLLYNNFIRKIILNDIITTINYWL